MARRVYFAFHYRDVANFPANVVRQSWVTHKDREEAGFFDASLWEETKKEGDLAIKRLINSALEGTSVTAVLIGQQTYLRRWVRYEIVKSLERGNGLLGIYIHNIPDKYRRTYPRGPNPFDYLHFRVDASGHYALIHEVVAGGWNPFADLPRVQMSGLRYRFLEGTNAGLFSKVFRTYDWVSDNGYDNLGMWVDWAAYEARK